MESVVAQRIKSVLEDNQISIAAFAKRIGMQQVTCNRQLRGDQAVSLGLLEGFLQEFDNVSAEWLLRGRGTKFIGDEGFMVAEPEPQMRQDKNVSQGESVWKTKYETIKECYDTLVASIGGVMGKRNVG